MEKDKISAEKIHLILIKSLKEFVDNQFSPDEKEIRIGVSQSTKHNLSTRSFKITISILFDCKNTTIAEYLFDFIFRIENMEDFLTEDQERQVFSGNLIGTLLSIAYSTTRGILYTKLADTYLKDFILPVINPNNLLKSKFIE